MIGLRLRPRVYLDSAAACPVLPAANRAFMRAMRAYGNPASPHTEGQEAAGVLSFARQQIAALAEVKPEAVIAVSGATEGNALGIIGHVEALIAAGTAPASLHVLYDQSAHRSLTQSVARLEALGVAIEALPYTDGALDLQSIGTLVRTQTCLVAVSAVCGETGRITPVRDIRRVLDKASEKHIILHVDGSQLPLVGAFELTRLGADMLVLDAQKVGGVRGVGVLIAPRRVPLQPLFEGGGQERGLRPGTPSPALLAAFAVALEEVHRTRGAFLSRAAAMRAIVRRTVETLDNAIVHEGKEQAPHIINVSLLGRDTDYLVALLDRDGFAVSTKSACEQNGEGSRSVLAATGSVEQATTTLRISVNPTTTMRDVRAFTRALSTNVNFLDTAGILKT